MIWLILSVVIWGLVHSVMASLKVKATLDNLLGAEVRHFYRLFYNIFSTFSFIPILWLMRILPDRTLYQIPSPWLTLLLLAQGLAAFGVLVGLYQTDLWEFVGLRQIISPRAKGESRLVLSGLYRHMRHPLYTFGLLFIWLSPVMTVNMLVVFIASTIYIVIGAYFEERKLLREFGEIYAEYQSNTPMLIPKIRF